MKKPTEPPILFTEPYIRSTDGAKMIAIKPGIYVNEAVERVLKGTTR